MDKPGEGGHVELLGSGEQTVSPAQGVSASFSGEVLTLDGPVLVGEAAFQRFRARMGERARSPIPKAAPSLKKAPTEVMQPTAKAMPQPELPQHPPPPARAAGNLAGSSSSPEPETESSPRKAPRLSQHEPPAGPDEHGRVEEGAASLPSSPELIPATPPSVELQGGHVELLEQTVSPAQGVSASPLRDAQGQFAWQRRSQSRDSLESELERILEDTVRAYDLCYGALMPPPHGYNWVQAEHVDNIWGLEQPPAQGLPRTWDNIELYSRLAQDTFFVLQWAHRHSGDILINANRVGDAQQNPGGFIRLPTPRGWSWRMLPPERLQWLSRELAREQSFFVGPALPTHRLERNY